MDLSHFPIIPEPARGFDFVEDVPRPRADVKPRAKVSQDDRNEEPPLHFSTVLGPRRIPKRRFPLRPSADMTKDARQGVLSKFLRAGEIIRASDLGPMVDLKTAKLNLTDNFELETDHLSEEEEQMSEVQRTEKKLFYIAVTTDELPSYHFWKAERDPDPFDARGADHSQLLKPTKLSPHDAAVVADFQRKNAERRVEHKRQVAKRKRQSTLKLKPMSTVKNAWTEAGEGEFYRVSNPKRESQLRTKNLVTPSVEPQWRPQGTLLGLPFNSSDQRLIKDSGQFGPKPGDTEWEEVEAAWEQRIQDVGLKSILEDLKKSDREKFDELSYGTKPSRIQPARGDDEYARQFNDVLKTSIPTVAFKLTLQHFERPVSPINSQEPLVRGTNPRGWDLQGEEPEDFDAAYEVVPYEEDELGFLDFYNEKSHEELMLRRRNPIPEEHIHQELSARNPHLAVFGDKIFDPSTSQQVPVGSGERLQSEFADYPAPPWLNYNRNNQNLSDSYLSDGDLSDRDFSSEELSDIEPSDEEPSDEEPSDEEPSDEGPSDEEPSDEEPSDEEPSDEESVGQGIDTIHCSITGMKCGVFVKSLSYEEFCKAAHRVVAWERGQNDKQTVEGFAFRIDPIDDSEPHSYYIKTGSAEPPYFQWLFRELPEILIVTIRVAETERGLPPVGEKVDSDHLKLIAPGLGHIFTAADWQRGASNLEDKACELLRTAISFLFAEESTQVTEFGEFRISVPGYPDHHVDLQSDAELKQEMRKVLSEIAENANTDAHASIFIYEEEIEMSSDRSESVEFDSVWTVEGPGFAAWFDYRAPFMFELFDLFVWEKIFRTSRKSAIIIIPNTEAWDLGLHSQRIGGNKPAITPREWNQYFSANFKPGESVHVMRLFREIQVHDGTRIIKNIESWRVADLYGESAFDIPGLMSSLAEISIRLLNIDPRKDSLGIKILAIKDEQHPAWVYFDSKTSERQFLQEVFFVIEEPTIEIFPVAPDELRPWPLRRRRELQEESIRKRKIAREEVQRQRALFKQAKPNEKNMVKTSPPNQPSGTINERQSERQSERQRQRDLEQQAQSNDIYAREPPSLNQQSEAVRERQASRLRSESVYNDVRGEIGIPQFSPSFEPEIRGGPDFPTIYPRVLTLAEIEHLKRQLRLREDQILLREKLIEDRNLQPILRQEQRAHLTENRRPVRPGVVRAIASKLPEKYDDKGTQTEGLGPTKQAHQGTQTDSLSPTKKAHQGTQTEGPSPTRNPYKKRQTVRAPSAFSNGGIEQTVETNDLPTKAASAVPESGPGGDLQDEPPSPTLPPKEKGKSYYCNICYVDTTRKNQEKKAEHALACGTTIDMTLVAVSKDDAMRKKQTTPITPAVNKKTKVGKTVTPGPTAEAPRTRGRKASSPLTEGLMESDNELSSPGRLKRKRTKTPTAGKKAAPKKRRR